MDLLLLLLPRRSGLSYLNTCMSVSAPSEQDGEIIELSCSLRELQITIRGTPAQATSFLASILPGTSAGRGISSAASDRSFELVGDSLSAPVVRTETRAEILESFAPCPASWISLASRLGGSQESAIRRIKRAWLAGLWAKAVLQDRAKTPNRSEPIDFKSRFYVVLRSDLPGSPAIYQSSGSYWRAVGGSFEGSSSLSHSFPSETEARVYLDAAGFESDVLLRQ